MPPSKQPLRIRGQAYGSDPRGETLRLKAVGRCHAESGVWGVPDMPLRADTGFISLGSNLFYAADSGKEADCQYGCGVLMRLNRADYTFSPVE